MPKTVDAQTAGHAFWDGRIPAVPAEYKPLMRWYLEKVAAQEKLYSDAGFDAQGLTNFLSDWFDAWARRDVPAIDRIMGKNMVYADPTTGSRQWTWNQEACDLYGFVFRLFPDMLYVAQDQTPRALPYFDFLDGFVRATVPWRAVGKLRLIGRYNIVGIDRYNLEREGGEWRIARIDTDFDLLNAFGQVLPLPFGAPREKTMNFLIRTAGRIIPGMRGPQLRPH